ncbi:MAG: zonular occludens toxin domain-containing protein [Lysobacteraceae bacterium]
MIYWYTGQPGHGKTLHAIDHMIEFKKNGRLCYVCNVRDFDYEKAGMLEMTPAQFRDWMNFLPDGAVALVDECYEHGMLPRRAPGATLPTHVEQLAKHRHRGIDFIFVSQSPDKQCDSFTHDLIDRHVHVKRRYGTQFVSLREFDRFEARAEKAVPLVTRRVKLPKRPMGLYKSTELDTTERRIPWFYYALVVGVPLALGYWFFLSSHMSDRLSGEEESAELKEKLGIAPGNGAQATVPGASPQLALPSGRDYAREMSPRIEGQPWTAPAYDSTAFAPHPPRLFCASSGWDGSDSCSCITDQGTVYFVQLDKCRIIARNGQLDPFYDARDQEANRLDAVDQKNRLRASLEEGGSLRGAVEVPSASPVRGAAVQSPYGRVAAYGDHALAPPGTLSIGDSAD